jgi:hypothetical protein
VDGPIEMGAVDQCLARPKHHCIMNHHELLL